MNDQQTQQLIRCGWTAGLPNYYLDYHDQVWGQPEHDDRALFKWLLLESFASGLSWKLILKKSSDFGQAFDDFDPQIIAGYGPEKVASLSANPNIVRHRGKIEGSVKNAQAFLEVQKDYGSFDAFIWSFTDGRTIENHNAATSQSDLSEQVCRVMKDKGFCWIGPVSVYSFLQSIGIVNDHEVTCSFNP